MLAVSMKDFAWRYQGRKSWALEDVNLEIEANCFVGVVGPNEAGKTTLISAIKGLVPNSFHGVIRGTIEIFGQDLREMSGLALARDIGMVFADPEAQFTSMTVEEELVFGMENIGFDLTKIKRQLDWVTGVTLIGDLLDKSPYEISGGQKQRVAIASVLAMQPRIMILDEPTSMLDPLGKDAVFEILENLKRDQELTIIVVEHNVEQIASLADLMVLVYGGKVVKVAPPADFLSDPDFLEAHDVYVPQATAFMHRLRRVGAYAGPLPVTFEDCVRAVEETLKAQMPA
jgi:energy-coupling factor transport system ATP-binding protein